MNADCVDCVALLDHCHGTVVLHEDGSATECTGRGCRDLDPARHALVTGCAQAMGECCADVGAVEFARAG